MNDLCRQAVYEGGLTLSSSGRQWRDFIPLSDVAQATRHLLALPSLTACPDVINLSLGASMTVREMAGLIVERARLMVQSDLALDIADHSAEPDYPPLTISNQRLLQSGFAFSADTAREIDGLLRFCMDTLSPQH